MDNLKAKSQIHAEHIILSPVTASKVCVAGPGDGKAKRHREPLRFCSPNGAE